MSNEKHNPDPFVGHEVLLTVEEAARRLRIGRTMAFSLLSTGELQSVRIGRRRLIPVEALRDFVRRLREADPTGEVA